MAWKKDFSRGRGFNQGKDGKFAPAPKRKQELPTAASMIEAKYGSRTQIQNDLLLDSNEKLLNAHSNMKKVLAKQKVDTGRPVKDTFSNLPPKVQQVIKGTSWVAGVFTSGLLAHKTGQSPDTVVRVAGESVSIATNLILDLAAVPYLFDKFSSGAKRVKAISGSVGEKIGDSDVASKVNRYKNNRYLHHRDKKLSRSAVDDRMLSSLKGMVYSTSVLGAGIFTQANNLMGSTNPSSSIFLHSVEIVSALCIAGSARSGFKATRDFAPGANSMGARNERITLLRKTSPHLFNSQKRDDGDGSNW